MTYSIVKVLSWPPVTSLLRVPENLTILDIRFSAGELAALDGACGPGGIIGNRYPAFVQKFAAQ